MQSRPRTARIRAINDFLQKRLRVTSLDEVTAVEAARWLNDADLLDDDATRPGRNLRRLLNSGEIEGAIQRPNQKNGNWFIAPARSDKADTRR